MTHSEKKIVLAWTHAQALHYAKSMGWARSEWSFIKPGDEYRIKGLYGIILYDVRAPRYKPTAQESERMERTRLEITIAQSSGRIAHTNVVNLP